MRIRRLIVRNIRSFRDLEWRPPDPNGRWNVILGDNGSGKSTFLRCLSLAIVGPREALAARLEWPRWLTENTESGTIAIEILPDAKYDQFSGKGRTGETKFVSASISLTKSEDGSVLPEKSLNIKTLSPERHIWGTGVGWFSAAYGPFRRFAGGDKEAERIYLSNPDLGAHISVFGENVALSEALYWLRELNYKRAEKAPEETELLERLEAFINQPGFLPHEVKLNKISSKGVEFEDSNGCIVPVEDLGDGYRSLLSMTFELIRQLVESFDLNRMFDDRNEVIIAPGVVLIDEVDAHLHPSWQKDIGFWLTRHFPHIQFIVSTHSPLVCHAAVNGSIFLLPTPGTDNKAKFVVGAELERLIYGDILEGLSTSAFGVTTTRSDESYARQRRLADLNLLELKQPLTDAEKEEQMQLRQSFPTSSSDTSPLTKDDQNT
jgi:hypothetical protein